VIGAAAARGMSRPTSIVLILVGIGDFADLFEVKSNRIVRRGRITTEWSQARQRLRTIYRGGRLALRREVANEDAVTDCRRDSTPGGPLAMMNSA
jgi:hypothetical protein